MRKMVLLASALLILTAGACGTEDSAVNARQAVVEPPTVPVEAGCSWDALHLDRDPMGINQLANISHAGIVGTVTDIAPARWNSRDGGKWCPPEDSDIRPILYRDVKVKVTEAIYTSEKFAPHPGDEVIVRAFGDGTRDGKEVYRFDNGQALREGETDGRFELGSEALLLLSVIENFPTEGGAEVVNQVTGSWGGNWEIDRGKDLARSVEPGRTVPFRALVARILKERREFGRAPERDVATKKNPLA